MQEKHSYWETPVSQGRTVNITCVFNSPATEAEIIQLEKAKGVKFPEEFLHFLRFSNGARLFTTEYGGGMEFHSINQILEYDLDYMPKNWIPIAYDNGDYLLFDSLKLAHNDLDYLMWHNHEQHFSNPSVRFNISFEKWIERYVIAQGSSFWQWNN